jgi:hypothetical protein
MLVIKIISDPYTETTQTGKVLSLQRGEIQGREYNASCSVMKPRDKSWTKGDLITPSGGSFVVNDYGSIKAKPWIDYVLLKQALNDLKSAGTV